MQLHIFNPEHDIALAANLTCFTAPHAARMLRNDLGFLPALWAAKGDAVVVDDVATARRSWQRLTQRLHVALGLDAVTADDVTFVDYTACRDVASAVTAIVPWGWDAALCEKLRRAGLPDDLLPTADTLHTTRMLSHRLTAAALLARLQQEGTIGEATACTTAATALHLIDKYGRAVVKAPWSSSGRGIRFVTSQEVAASQHFMGWLQGVLRRQGTVMVEPYYDHVLDFAAEFTVDATGAIRYVGLSLFNTTGGAYTGNLLATEQHKREQLSRYVSLDLFDRVCGQVAALLKLPGYSGPFGIDMMACRTATGNRLHPCVEINLRRTMGHAALAMSPTDDDIVRAMRITFDGNKYHIRINRL